MRSHLFLGLQWLTRALEVRAHHQKQRSDSLPRRIGEESSVRSRSSSAGRLTRSRTRPLERPRPVLLSNQEIKAQLLAPTGVRPRCLRLD